MIAKNAYDTPNKTGLLMTVLPILLINYEVSNNIKILPEISPPIFGYVETKLPLKLKDVVVQIVHKNY